jgi:hypothetical protein
MHIDIDRGLVYTKGDFKSKIAVSQSMNFGMVYQSLKIIWIDAEQKCYRSKIKFC